MGPRPGRVDVRGKVGASRAIQAALADAGNRFPEALAAVLEAVIAEGDPLRDLLPRPPKHAGVCGRRALRKQEMLSGLTGAKHPILVGPAGRWFCTRYYEA